MTLPGRDSQLGWLKLVAFIGAIVKSGVRELIKRRLCWFAPVHVFKVEKRRHWFALTEDVAAWLSTLQQKTPDPQSTQERSTPRT